MQLGDPLAPDLFLFEIDILTESVTYEFSCCYLDDASLGGTPVILFGNASVVEKRLQEISLGITASICESYMY